MAHHAFGWQHAAGHIQIVGDRQQRADIDAVGFGAFGQPRIPVGGRRQLLGIKPALGTGGHDHGVLHLLRLDQPQHFGAEIVAPVRPAQAAARDGPAAQVDAFDARGIHPDFAVRHRRRQAGNQRRIQLERHRLRPARHIEIGAQRGQHGGTVQPQDAIIIDAGHIGQAGIDARQHISLRRAAIGHIQIETRGKQRHQLLRDRRITLERIHRRHHAIGNAGLPQIAEPGAQQGSFPGIQPAGQDQRIEAIIFLGARQHIRQRRGRPRCQRIQIRLNDLLVVDYVEPENPVADPGRPGRRLSRGTFALQGHDPESKVSYKNILVKPLPDNLPDYPDGPVRFDAVDEQIVKLGTANFPLVDFHTHLKGGLTLEGVLQHMFKTGLNHGVAVNCGVGFAITNDAGVDDFLKSLAGQPVFVGMQAEGREWPKLFSPATVARFDYVFTDSMTIFDHRGKRARLWINDEVEIPDKQAFMEHLVDTIVKILNEEPVDIYVNPTFLPEIIAREYDALWTPERMQRVVDAAKKNGVAIELNSRYRLPGLQFVKLAKKAGLKFTLGTNNSDSNLGRDEFGLEMITACGLTYKDFWMPKPEGQKPIQTKRTP